MFNSFVFVDVISELFAQITLMGSCAISLPGKSLPKKCPVHAESGFVFITIVLAIRFCNLLFVVIGLQLVTAIAYDIFGLIMLGEDAIV